MSSDSSENGVIELPPMSSMPGGYTPAKTKDESLENELKALTSVLNEHLNLQATTYNLVSFRTAVVAGIKYECKLRVDDLEQFVEVIAFRPMRQPDLILSSAKII